MTTKRDDDMEKELAALSAIINALLPLDPAARVRILRYAADRWRVISLASETERGPNEQT